MPRPKAKIVTIGIIINGEPIGWRFDCQGIIPGIEILANGMILYGGYSVDELEQEQKKFEKTHG